MLTISTHKLLPPSDEGGGFCPRAKLGGREKTGGNINLPFVILKYGDGSLYNSRQRLHSFSAYLAQPKTTAFDSSAVGKTRTDSSPNRKITIVIFTIVVYNKCE